MELKRDNEKTEDDPHTIKCRLLSSVIAAIDSAYRTKVRFAGLSVDSILVSNVTNVPTVFFDWHATEDDAAIIGERPLVFIRALTKKLFPDGSVAQLWDTTMHNCFKKHENTYDLFATFRSIVA